MSYLPFNSFSYKPSLWYVSSPQFFGMPNFANARFHSFFFYSFIFCQFFLFHISHCTLHWCLSCMFSLTFPFSYFFLFYFCCSHRHVFLWSTSRTGFFVPVFKKCVIGEAFFNWSLTEAWRLTDRKKEKKSIWFHHTLSDKHFHTRNYLHQSVCLSIYISLSNVMQSWARR